MGTSRNIKTAGHRAKERDKTDEELLDKDLADTFPASDPPAATQPHPKKQS